MLPLGRAKVAQTPGHARDMAPNAYLSSTTPRGLPSQFIQKV